MTGLEGHTQPGQATGERHPQPAPGLSVCRVTADGLRVCRASEGGATVSPETPGKELFPAPRAGGSKPGALGLGPQLLTYYQQVACKPHPVGDLAPSLITSASGVGWTESPCGVGVAIRRSVKHRRRAVRLAVLHGFRARLGPVPPWSAGGGGRWLRARPHGAVWGWCALPDGRRVSARKPLPCSRLDLQGRHSRTPEKHTAVGKPRQGKTEPGAGVSPRGSPRPKSLLLGRGRWGCWRRGTLPSVHVAQATRAPAVTPRLRPGPRGGNDLSHPTPKTPATPEVPGQRDFIQIRLCSRKTV